MALMLASRFCRAPVLQKSNFILRQPQNNNVYRTFANEGKEAFTRTAARRRTTLKEKLMAPAGDTGTQLELN